MIRRLGSSPSVQMAIGRRRFNANSHGRNRYRKDGVSPRSDGRAREGSSQEAVLTEPTARLYSKSPDLFDWNGSLLRSALFGPHSCKSEPPCSSDSCAICEAVSEIQQE